MSCCGLSCAFYLCGAARHCACAVFVGCKQNMQAVAGNIYVLTMHPYPFWLQVFSESHRYSFSDAWQCCRWRRSCLSARRGFVDGQPDQQACFHEHHLCQGVLGLFHFSVGYGGATTYGDTASLDQPRTVGARAGVPTPGGCSCSRRARQLVVRDRDLELVGCAFLFEPIPEVSLARA